MHSFGYERGKGKIRGVLVSHGDDRKPSASANDEKSSPAETGKETDDDVRRRKTGLSVSRTRT